MAAKTPDEALRRRNVTPPPARRAFLLHYRLRPMRSADLTAVMAIEERAYEFPWSCGVFEDCLRVGYCCWICEDEWHLYGYGVMSVGAAECHILNLCIAPASQGQGLGRHLMDHLLHLGRRHDADTAFLEVRPSNQAAIQLYLSMGFNEVGMRRAYYPARKGREDALILARSL
jgi:ribosomal-protein-alanine N-acetyltransferase